MLHGVVEATIVNVNVDHRHNHARQWEVLEVLAEIIAATNHFLILEVLELLLAVQRPQGR